MNAEQKYTSKPSNKFYELVCFDNFFVIEGLP